jgi:predicted dehydrogenase
MALECWDFIDSVLNRRRPEISAEDTLRAKAVCLAIYESATAGVPVKVQDVIDGTVSAYQDPINRHWGI